MTVSVYLTDNLTVSTTDNLKLLTIPQGFLPLLHTCNIAVSKLLETEQIPSYQDRDGNLMQVNVLKVWYRLAR